VKSWVVCNKSKSRQNYSKAKVWKAKKSQQNHVKQKSAKQKSGRAVMSLDLQVVNLITHLRWWWYYPFLHHNVCFVNCLAHFVLSFCLQDTALHYFNQMLLFTVDGIYASVSTPMLNWFKYQIIKLKIAHLKKLL
jgi:hypothetical protein